jgi:hypothetical protein
VFGGGRVTPFAGARASEAHIQALPRRVGHIADVPIAAAATTIRQIVPTDCLGVLRQALSDLARALALTMSRHRRCCARPGRLLPQGCRDAKGPSLRRVGLGRSTTGPDLPNTRARCIGSSRQRTSLYRSKTTLETCLRSLAFWHMFLVCSRAYLHAYRSRGARPRSGVQVTREAPIQPVTAWPRSASSAGFQGARVKVSSRRMRASVSVGVTMGRS